jgi:hypothetical protein
MSAIEKSIERHQKKLATKKQPQKVSSVPWGCGMGWPEAKDYPSRAEYIAARVAADPNYAPGHDGRLWMLPG